MEDRGKLKRNVSFSEENEIYEIIWKSSLFQIIWASMLKDKLPLQYNTNYNWSWAIVMQDCNLWHVLKTWSDKWRMSYL
jgi:hypothetical protein